MKSLYDYCYECDLLHLLVQWDGEKNGDLTTQDVTYGSHKKVWWRCESGHSWQAPIFSRTGNKAGCPYCSKRIIISGENDLSTTHPHLAVQWNNAKNAPLTPREVASGSNRKVWWVGECGHEWQASILSRTSTQSGCPVCAGKQIIPGENDLQSQFPQIAAQWCAERNGNLTPDSVASYSNRRVWWQCEKGHAYQSIIAHRTKNASGCPYCAGRKVLAGFNDLETIYPMIAKQWHPTLNGTLTPSMVTINSHQKVWWQCEEGHVWKAVIYSRTSERKHGCPVCAGRVKQSSQRYYYG